MELFVADIEGDIQRKKEIYDILFEYKILEKKWKIKSTTLCWI